MNLPEEIVTIEDGGKLYIMPIAVVNSEGEYIRLL